MLPNKQMQKYSLIDNFLESSVADSYFARLLNLPWKEVKWGPTKRTLPRLVYSYNGESTGIVLLELKQIIETNFPVIGKIRGIWCNQYRNGDDYTPEHQDSYGGYVFTLSFGAPRRLVFRRIDNNEKITLNTKHGSLYYFSSQMNSENKHSVPKATKAEKVLGDGIRLSIVFFT